MTNDECRRNDETPMVKLRSFVRSYFRCMPSRSFRYSPFVLCHYHHLSHSPMTKSRLPSTAGTSLTMQPGSSSGRILRFTNDGARIFSRYGTPPPLLLM